MDNVLRIDMMSGDIWYVSTELSIKELLNSARDDGGFIITEEFALNIVDISSICVVTDEDEEEN